MAEQQSVSRDDPGSPGRVRPTSWFQRVLMIDDRKAWLERARESIVDLNHGIVTAAGIGEGFAAAGATTTVFVFAGATVILTGGFAAAANKYGEERTEWEMNQRLVEAERAGTENIEPARANVFAAVNAGLFFAL